MIKPAFLGMDVESLYESKTFNERAVYKIDKNYSSCDGIGVFLDFLKEQNLKATFFVTVSFYDKCKEFLKRAVSEGHEIGVHGLEHVSPIEENIDDFKKELSKAKQFLESELNIAIKAYRAPCFGINDQVLKVVQELGFVYDSSNLDFSLAVNSGSFSLENYHKLNDCVYEENGFFEFKPAIGRLFGKNIPVSGGGYIRLIPWIAISHSVKKYIKNANGYLFYLHPFEISKNKLPKFKKLSWVRRLYFKQGRRSFLKKIKKLILLLKKCGYEFYTFSQFDNAIKGEIENGR